jgi:Putative Flp pilus-assembly TadE/G-like
MKSKIVSVLRRVHNEESGQVLLWVTVGLVGFLGLAGLTVDVGRAYVAYDQLQASTNAAALAAAGATYNSSGATVSSQASLYGSGTGGKNVNSSFGTVQTNATAVCLNILMPKGTTCGSGTTPNAVSVTQTATVSTFFLRVLGINSVPLKATAKAAMQGVSEQWNVAIIVDSTGSMATTDSNCGGATEFQCALSGIQSMLALVNPCAPGYTSCTPTSNSNLRVALFTFPNVSTGTVVDDINCGGSPGSIGHPTAEPYTLPIPGKPMLVQSDGTVYMSYTQTASPHTQWNATYQITPFGTDFYDPTNTSSGGLNTSSNLVKAVGYGTTAGCLTYTQGILNSGFGNTYFASSIYAAQAALTTAQAAHPGSKNAIIFLSDGQANASYYSKNSGAYGGVNQGTHATEFPEAPANSEVGPNTTPYATPATLTTGLSQQGYDTLSSTSGTGGNRSGTTKGIYPDWYDQCQQAIAAAQYVQGLGTTVYSVAYGAESSGCSNGWSVGATDTTLVASSTINPFTISSLLPCTTMEDMASTWEQFYSDNQQSANVNLGCVDNSHATVALKDIFRSIASSLTNPQLLPKNAQ